MSRCAAASRASARRSRRCAPPATARARPACARRNRRSVPPPRARPRSLPAKPSERPTTLPKKSPRRKHDEPADVKIRALCEADIPQVERILAIAFARPMGALAMRIRLAPLDWLAAEVDAVPAGVVSARRYGEVAYIGSMAVDPERQRRGIGFALMQAMVARLEEAGISTLLLDATDAGAPLYEKFGFRTYDWTHYYERAPEPRNGPAISPDVSNDALNEAIALDRRFYGCDRSEMLALLAREPGAMLTVAADGYLMARETAIGPFVAESDETARELFEAARARRSDLIRGWAPGLNPAARRLFEDAGFPLVRSVRHMGRGASPLRRDRIFSQASHGHG